MQLMESALCQDLSIYALFIDCHESHLRTYQGYKITFFEEYPLQ